MQQIMCCPVILHEISGFSSSFYFSNLRYLMCLYFVIISCHGSWINFIQNPCFVLIYFAPLLLWGRGAAVYSNNAAHSDERKGQICVDAVAPWRGTLERNDEEGGDRDAGPATGVIQAKWSSQRWDSSAWAALGTPVPREHHWHLQSGTSSVIPGKFPSDSYCWDAVAQYSQDKVLNSLNMKC